MGKGQSSIAVRGITLALFHAVGVALRRNRITITPHRAFKEY